MKTLSTAIAVLLLLPTFALAQFDGPAELPRRAPLLSISSPNPPKTVGPTDSLQAAINTAVAGDTFLVDPTNVTTGQLTFPNLGPACDPGNGITIRTSGTLAETATHRVIPGQPMPKIVVRGSLAMAGGTCLMLYGIEVLRLPGTGTIYNLYQPNTGSTNILLDHVYFHGTPTDETVRGIYTGGGVKNLTVENSYFADFHCKALGTCGDAQAINCGIGDGPDSGNYLFQNNYLEGAAENFICGGGGDQFTPTDITLQDNDIVKPSRWNPLSPDYAGIPWIVKNFVEFKNCVRCLVQRNRLIGDWGGYSQLGYGFLVTAKNQNGNCPVCTVTDITIRQNWMSTSGQFAQIALVPSGTGDWAKDQARISVHDNHPRGTRFEIELPA